MNMTLVIDGVILALLAGTLGYAFLVDRRVRMLIAALKDLQPMVGEFSAAVDKSETSVAALKDAAEGLTDPVRAPRAAAASTGAAPEAGEASTTSGGMFFQSRRASARVAVGVAPIAGKSDLVRSFFETARGREA